MFLNVKTHLGYKFVLPGIKDYNNVIKVFSYEIRVVSRDHREVIANRVEKIEESFEDGGIASVWSQGGNGGALWHLTRMGKRAWMGRCMRRSM